MDISEISFHCIDKASDNEAEDINSDFYRRRIGLMTTGRKGFF